MAYTLAEKTVVSVGKTCDGRYVIKGDIATPGNQDLGVLYKLEPSQNVSVYGTGRANPTHILEVDGTLHYCNFISTDGSKNRKWRELCVTAGANTHEVEGCVGKYYVVTRTNPVDRVEFKQLCK